MSYGNVELEGSHMGLILIKRTYTGMLLEVRYGQHV
jgi:hypothetical protein